MMTLRSASSCSSIGRSVGVVGYCVGGGLRETSGSATVVGTARGHGFATHAVRLATDWALDLNQIDRIEAWVELDNVPSRRVVESVGFELEGRLRNFLAFPTRRADALSYSRIPE